VQDALSGFVVEPTHRKSCKRNIHGLGSYVTAVWYRGQSLRIDSISTISDAFCRGLMISYLWTTQKLPRRSWEIECNRRLVDRRRLWFYIELGDLGARRFEYLDDKPGTWSGGIGDSWRGRTSVEAPQSHR
jgi:hypothetical protein